MKRVHRILAGEAAHRPYFGFNYLTRPCRDEYGGRERADVGRVIIACAVTGPLFHYCDTWQLIINTGTTIVTFLMVFLLQNTQNRDTAAIQLKLDELIRANRDARNMMFGLEDLSEKDLKKSKATFASLADALTAAVTPGRRPSH